MSTTSKSLGPFASALADPGRRRPARDSVPKDQRVGVVFVHGIGSQKPGETLLQWSEPLVRILTEWWRWPDPNPAERSLPGATEGDPDDPVIEAAFDLESPLPTIVLRVPETSFPDRTHPAAEWVLTEAWWASRVSPPGLSTMTSWLGPGGGAGRVVSAILANRAAESIPARVGQAFLVPFVTVLAGIILTLYTIVRAVIAVIPFQSVKDAAILRAFDEFLIGWFGDVRILLYDPVQSANIRAGLADAVLRLRETCGQVVVVAHSGGVMVSYLTLTDPALRQDVQVDKLITFGEGWNLALQLTDDGGGTWDRIRANLLEAQPSLRWRDFYASHDPAPAGKLRLDASRPPMEPGPRIRSTEVWNRRSLLGDHGGYFDNDEEFTIPVLRELDVPTGWGETSRFYREDVAIPGSPPPPLPVPLGLPTDPRARRHQQRIALLALWRHVIVVAGVATVAAALRFAPDRLVEIGRTVADRLPDGVPVVTDLVSAVASFASSGIDGVQIDLPILPATPPGWLADMTELLGRGVLQGIVLISAGYLLIAGPWAFRAWPARSPVWWVILAAESLSYLAVLSVLAVFSPGHHELLGTGLDWLPGVGVMVGTLAIAYLGTRLAYRSRSAVVSNGYAAVAILVFGLALASSVVAIFRIEELADAEFGYAAIWVGAFALLTIGRGRWAGWDRVERQIAHGPVGSVEVDRRPVLATSSGVVVLAVAFVGFILVGPTGWVEWIGGLGLLLIVVGMGLGARFWRTRLDPVASPGPVERAGV